MAVDLGNLFHFLLPLVFCSAGFHGVLFYSSPWKKTASWCAFQAGLVFFLLGLASPATALPLVLAVLTAFLTLAVGLLLVFFCGKVEGRLKSSEGGKTARPPSPRLRGTGRGKFFYFKGIRS